MDDYFIKEKEGIKASGVITIRSYKAGTKELLKTIVQKNLIMQGTNIGKDLIVQRLLGGNTYSLNINWGAIGTSSAVVAVTDTKLGVEIIRTAVASTTNVGNNQAQIQFFFSDSVLANDTYKEFGMFVDGTSAKDSGQIFNHASFTVAYVKVAGSDTTVECDVTLT